MGDRCHFAHGPQEMRKADDVPVADQPLPENTPIANSSKLASISNCLPKDKMATNYKTTMCKFFEEGKYSQVTQSVQVQRQLHVCARRPRDPHPDGKRQSHRWAADAIEPSF